MLDLTKFSPQKTCSCGIGEILFDIYDGIPHLGGAPANFAYHMHALGIKSKMISAVGNDDLGKKARQILDENSIESYLQTSCKPTGYVSVSLDENKIPSYSFLDDTAYDNLEFDDNLKAQATNTNIACFGTLAQRNEKSRLSILSFLDAMKDDARLRIFDVNLRQNFFSKEIILQSLKRCEAIKCNEDEIESIALICGLKEYKGPEQFFKFLRSININLFIFTEGSKQSTVFLNKEISVIKTPKVQVVDTVGAGDCFTAAIISSIIEGKPLKEAHQFAVNLSAYVCTKKGAMPNLKDFLALRQICG